MIFEVEELKTPTPFQTESGKTVTYLQGKATRYAMLTEDHCYFILTLMNNNPKVVEAKLKLVTAFRDARKQLAQRDIARIDGKVARIAETGAIKELVDYAEANGSSNAEMYYQTITRMTNKLLNIEAGKRNKLSTDILVDIHPALKGEVLRRVG